MGRGSQLCCHAEVPMPHQFPESILVKLKNTETSVALRCHTLPAPQPFFTPTFHIAILCSNRLQKYPLKACESQALNIKVAYQYGLIAVMD